MKLQNGDTIVFAGDSVTDAAKLQTPDHLGLGYVHLISDALTAYRPWDVFRVVNAGISGNTSRDLLARWETDVAALEPDVLFCMVGMNDVWRHFDTYRKDETYFVSVQEYRQNIRKICELGRQAREFCMMTPYIMQDCRQDEIRALLEKYVAAMKEVTSEYGVPVIDMQHEFDEFMKYRSGAFINHDRVHPGRIGRMILARAIWHEFE